MSIEAKESVEQDKLTPVQKKRLDEFNRTRTDLLEQGYKEKQLTVSIAKANIRVMIAAVPITALGHLLYLVVHGRSQRINLWFLLVLLLGMVVHELLHAITWACSCKKGWKAIGFGLDAATFSPYCYCNEGMTLLQYSLGAAMPTVVLGILPYVIGLMFGNYYLAMFGLFQVLGGGGDLFVLRLIRRENNAILMDHPYLAGCVAFEK